MGSDSPVVECRGCGRKNRVRQSAGGRPRCGHCREALPWVVDASDASFATATDTQLLVLVDLWAPWCGPCLLVAPVLERLAAAYAGRLKIVKVNVDESPRLAEKFRATSIPMLLFLHQGNVVDTVVGAQPDHVLRQRIEAILPSVEQG